MKERKKEPVMQNKFIAAIIAAIVILSLCMVARADTTKPNVITSICEWLDDSHTSAMEELLGE